MPKKLIRTNERCYICDFSSPFDNEEGSFELGGVGGSLYQDSLSESQQDPKGGRHVFLHPYDGKPVCTQCSEVVRNMVKALKFKDTLSTPYSWRDTNHEMFKKWEEKLIAESLEGSPVQDAETREGTEVETT